MITRLYGQAGLSHIRATVLALVSGLLLAAPLLYPPLFALMWLAFVPLLIAVHRATLWQAYVWGLLSGLTLGMAAAYWIIDFLMLSKGYGFMLSLVWGALFWLYTAQLPALIILLFAWLRRRTGLHDYILFPVTTAALCAVFPLLFPFRPGETQTEFLMALQAAALFGVSGLDFIIALVNIMLLHALLRLSRLATLLPALGLVVAWFLYGWYWLGQWDELVARQDTISFGLVQPNERPTLQRSPVYPGYSRAFPPEMEMTQRLAAAGAEIVVWPEARDKDYFQDKAVARAFTNVIDNLDISLIFQDIESGEKGSPASPVVQYNTAVMIANDGQEAARYRKMKRIPFGEYVPLVSDVPALRVRAENFLGEFLNEIAAGQAYEDFTTAAITMVPLICYETVFPVFVAEAVASVARAETGPGRPGGLLLAMSSNGWFGATRQPYQHVHSAILRAVENRLPMVHVVNNGPSVVALPHGRIIFMSPPQHAGGWLVDVPVASNFDSSFFSQYPRIFRYFLLGLLGACIALALTRLKSPNSRRIDDRQ